MKIQSDVSQPGLAGGLLPSFGLRLAGGARKIVLIIWGLITILSLLSFTLGVFGLNVWDRVPAAQAPHYFPEMTPQDVQSHADYQNVVLQSGMSLAGYALIFSSVRILGGLAMFLAGFLLILRYSDRLPAVLMAFLLSVFAAAGIWGNPLFNWAVSLAPWMKFPASLLAWLLWCGVIVIYTFPDGKFKPRGLFWMAILVIPISLIFAFKINIFLNPDNWPSPFDLLPNILFIGGALFSILYRHGRSSDPAKNRRLGWYVLSLSLLITVYFVDFFINNVYPLGGNLLIQGYQAGMKYALIYEPVWYALEVFFAVSLTISVFRNKLLEN
jgi:hypothetical protein